MAGKRELKVEILGDASSAQRAMGSLDGHSGKLSGALKGIGIAAAGAGVAVVAGLKGAIDEAREAAEVGRATEAVIKSTGGVAGVTAGHVGKLAEKLSNMAGIDDELIQHGENVLLTFTSIRNEVGKGNDVFDRASAIALDMSTALGTDLQGSIIKVGKALNDPIKGLTALSRVGVSFTTDQKVMIKQLQHSGDLLGAQKVILDELGKEFGGAAEAAADPMQKLGVVVGNLKERVGTALLPIVEKAADWLGTMLPAALDFLSRTFGTLKYWVDTFISTFKFRDAGENVGDFSDKVAAFAIVVGRAFDDVKAVIGNVVDFVSGVLDRFRGDHERAAGGVSEASGKIKKLLEGLRDTFSSLFGAIRAIVETAIAIMKDLWDRFGHTLIDKIGVALRGVIDTLTGATQTLTGIFDFIKAILTGKWGEAWEAIKKILGGAWDTIVGIFKVQNAVLSAIFEGIKAALSMIWGGMWNMLKTLASDAWAGIKDATSWLAAGFIDFFKKLPGRILDALGDLSKLLFNKGKELIGGFIDGIKDMAGSVVDAVRDTVGDAAGRVGSWLNPTKAGSKAPGTRAAGHVTDVSMGARAAIAALPQDWDPSVVLGMLRRGGTLTAGGQTYGGAPVTIHMGKPTPGSKLDGMEVYAALREAQRQSGALRLKIA